MIDPDLLIHFEVTPHRTVFFYLTVFGSMLVVVRGMIPEETRVFDPELLMTELIQYTHYMPDEWKDQLHSKKVRHSLICPNPCGNVFSLLTSIYLDRFMRSLANFSL